MAVGTCELRRQLVRHDEYDIGRIYRHLQPHLLDLRGEGTVQYPKLPAGIASFVTRQPVHKIGDVPRADQSG